MRVELSPRRIECQSWDGRSDVDVEEAETQTPLIRRSFSLTRQVNAVGFNRDCPTGGRDELARNDHAPVEVPIRLERANFPAACGNPDVRR